MVTQTGIDVAPAGRSARKHQAILQAGQELFLRKGFDRTTMDEVAALARVSKQTVYKHFADKEQLFTAIIETEIDAAEDVTHDQVAALGTSDDLERDLRAFARQHVVDVTSHEVVTMRRIVIAEAERFPELARTWYSSGPGRAHEVLAEQLAQLHRRGLLEVPDPALAAQQLNWLIISIPLNEATFTGEPIAFDDADLQRYADAAIDVFLAAYRRP
jgi:TetR/AcrR family transcriptional repressor of mexJK operon